MQSAAQAYSTAAKQIVGPPELEGDLLLKPASRHSSDGNGPGRRRPPGGNSCRVGSPRNHQADFGGSGLNASATPLMQ